MVSCCTHTSSSLFPTSGDHSHDHGHGGPLLAPDEVIHKNVQYYIMFV